MTTRARYDDKFRASAIVMLEAAGYPAMKGAMERVARELNIPMATLSRWARGISNPPPTDIVSEKRVELADLLRAEISAALGEMDKARETASYRDLGTVAGILIDKLQLITGKPTERSAIQINVDELTDDELARIASSGG